MVSSRAYLDWNASAPLSSAARTAMLDALDAPGNASSVHSEGRRQRQIVEDARRAVAELTGGKPEHVVFTSGATEAATWLLSPDWRMGRGPLHLSRLYVCAADHPCILNGGRFGPESISQIPVDSQGVVDLTALRSLLATHDRDGGLPLVAVHAVNNETGVIQPFAEIAAITREAGGIFVLDAVQAAGRVPLDLSGGIADYLLLSSHKIGGPKGAGAVVAAADLMMPVPLLVGGGQEKGHRAGTENVAAIAGFGAAAREACMALSRVDAIGLLRDRMEHSIKQMAPGAVIYGADAPRVANTSFFAIPGMKAETAQIAFDLAGIAVSSGSACSSGKVGPSHVLKAMGFGDDAGALRVSIGPSTTDAEVVLFETALEQILERSRQKAVA